MRPSTLRAVPLVALGLLLSGCTSSTPAPTPSDVPDVTVRTVHVSALAGDEEASLLSRVAVAALGASDFDARLVDAKGVDSKEAVASLTEHTADVVIGGAADWLPVLTPAGAATAATGGPTPSGTTAPSAPADGTQATQRITDALPEGLAVGTAARTERTDILVTTSSISGLHGLGQGKTPGGLCATASLAVAQQWWSAWGVSWQKAAACTPRKIVNEPGTDEAVAQLVAGRSELAIARAGDPRLSDRGLVELKLPAAAGIADPLVGVISADRVGKDALEVLGKVSAVAKGDEWGQLLRLDAAGGLDEADLRLWLVRNGVLDGGATLPATPQGSTGS